ncbi:restriction endonuclease subunit S [Legionella pneumophila serogroup 1]
MSNKVYTSVKQNIRPKLRFPEFQAAQEWEIKLLGDLIYYENGKAHEQNISDMGKYIVVNSKFISTEGEVKKFTNDGLCIANKGDILMVLSDVPNGKAIAKCFLVGQDELYTVNQRICLIKPKSSVSEFIYYIINRNPFYLNFDDGVKQTNLRKDDVLSCPIIVPSSKKEQQKIADCLSSIDELITAERKKLDALKTYKKGLIQQLFPAEDETFPKLRFPEFIDSGNWKKMRVVDIASKEIKWSFTGGPFGSNLKSSDYTNTGIRVIQLQNIGDGEFVDNYKIYTSENKANELLSCNIYPGEIILSKMGDPVARACLVPDKDKRYVMCSDGIRLAVDKNKFDNYFIYSLINSEIFRAIAEKSSTGSTRKRIGLDILKNLKVMVPMIQEQQKIAELLSLVDDFITNQCKKMDALKNHKKGLMQQLFPTMNELKG